MSTWTESEVLDALGVVKDPQTGVSITTMHMVKDLHIEETRVSLRVVLNAALTQQIKRKLTREVIEALSVLGEPEVSVTIGTSVAHAAPSDEPLSQAKHVILVSSGKGGVGKSTVASNLAVSLAIQGAKVGLLDADLYGPSVPVMMGIEEHQKPRLIEVDGEEMIEPLEAHGVELISMGFFVAPQTAVSWRGPMIHKALMQFMKEVAWSELDYIVLDLPPGTGDIQMTLAQQVPVSGAVIVTTPQLVALADVIRAQAFFEQLEVPVLGVVENMSYFVCSDCDARHALFSSGGGAHMAEQLELPMLAEIPLYPSLREWADRGIPESIADPDSPPAQAFHALAAKIMKALPC